MDNTSTMTASISSLVNLFKLNDVHLCYDKFLRLKFKFFTLHISITSAIMQELIISALVFPIYLSTAPWCLCHV